MSKQLKVDFPNVVDTTTNETVGTALQLHKLDFSRHPNECLEFVAAVGRDGKMTAGLNVIEPGLVLAGCTGAFATRFPKTKPAVSTFGNKDGPVASEESGPSKKQKSERYSVGIDLSTDFNDGKQAKEFKLFCDRLDGMLVDFYASNPTLLGMSRTTPRTNVEGLLKKTFKVNVSKTGTEYPPSASFYKQAYNEVDARADIDDQNGRPLPTSFTIPQDSVVRVGVLYTGPKIHLGRFSNGWTLLKIQYLGLIGEKNWPGFSSESITSQEDEKIAQATALVQFGGWE
jgi:hypothetical protein